VSFFRALHTDMDNSALLVQGLQTLCTLAPETSTEWSSSAIPLLLPLLDHHLRNKGVLQPSLLLLRGVLLASDYEEKVWQAPGGLLTVPRDVVGQTGPRCRAAGVH
jgi:hypothetical protein